MERCWFVFFFFFQAEDGIRDLTVTGVQTCALPISLRPGLQGAGRWASRAAAALPQVSQRRPGDPRAAARVRAGPAPLRQGTRDPACQERPRDGDSLDAAGAHDGPRSAHRPHRRRAARAGLVGGRPMSRIGRKPIPIPKGVTTQLDGLRITVKGPKGEISRLIHAELAVAVEGETIVVRRPSDESRHKALHGLTRTLVANMVDGVTKGFAKALEIQGVGYKAEPKPFGVQLVVGFSHPVPYHAPQGIKI